MDSLQSKNEEEELEQILKESLQMIKKQSVKKTILNSNMFRTATKVEETTTMFFKIGSNPVYSDSILVYVYQDGLETYWSPVDDPNDLIYRKLKTPQEVKILMEGALLESVNKIGRFIIYGQKWGFLLNLQSCEDIYEGNITELWITILSLQFFQDLFRKYAFYILQEEEEQKDHLSYKSNKIPTSIDDLPIEELKVPFYKDLFWHQTKEIGWMSRLELNNEIEYPIDLKYIPLLDTGFYFNPSDPKDIKKKNELKSIKYSMPGGILASEIGSGKTISVIGLISVGYQLNLKSFQDEMLQKLKKGELQQYQMMPPQLLKKQQQQQQQEKQKQQQQQQQQKQQEEKKKDEVPQMELNDEERSFEKDQISRQIYIQYDGIQLPSLIIVTKNILYQWKEEIQKFAPYIRLVVIEHVHDLHKLKVNTLKSPISGKQYTVLQDYDIILTHRHVLLFQQMHKIPCFTCNFQRIIFDEMHEITSTYSQLYSKNKGKLQVNVNMDQEFKNGVQLLYQNISQMKRKFTWGITGTPDNLDFLNNTESMGLLLNLHTDFYQINNFDKLKENFLYFCMRSNKKSVKLPKLEKTIKKIFFNQLQNIIYQGKANYGYDEVSAREICSHMLNQYEFIKNVEDMHYEQAINLIQNQLKSEIEKLQLQLKKDNSQFVQNRLNILYGESNFYTDIINLLKGDQFNCILDLEDHSKKELVVTECLHYMCEQCYNNLFKHFGNPMCPQCKENISDYKVIIHPRMDKKQESKINALLNQIADVPPDEKIIIYTEFHDLTLKIAALLDQIEVQYVILKGEPSEINIRLNKFKKIPEIKILIMSIEQAASGINITEANHVFFIHPIFGMLPNKAKITYQQCIGRVLRIGQKKPVQAMVFVTSNSLEEHYVKQFLE